MIKILSNIDRNSVVSQIIIHVRHSPQRLYRYRVDLSLPTVIRVRELTVLLLTVTHTRRREWTRVYQYHRQVPHLKNYPPRDLVLATR
jgi:hypothetical protein